MLAGEQGCPGLAHALHVAEYLHQNLPSFEFRVIEKEEIQWMVLSLLISFCFNKKNFFPKIWLEQINTKYGWHVTKSPVIWKEITRMGSKPYLIGGLSEFWEYCFDYYGFQSRMSKSDIEKLVLDNALIVFFFCILCIIFN